MATKPMTTAHKEAMAAGRAEGRVVKAYLDALNAEVADAGSLQRLQLLQERRDLEAELDAKSGPGADLAALEAGFVKVARAYGQRKGIAYATWREMGVPADVLGRAGITRGG